MQINGKVAGRIEDEEPMTDNGHVFHPQWPRAVKITFIRVRYGIYLLICWDSAMTKIIVVKNPFFFMRGR